MFQVQQIVPPERCLACDVCCRFNQAGSLMAPVFSAAEMSAAVEAGLSGAAFCQSGYEVAEPAILKPGAGRFLCPGFDEGSNRCRIYLHRPLDCRLYPFVVTLDPTGSCVSLAADIACPCVVENLSGTRFRVAAQALADALERMPDEALAAGALPLAFYQCGFEDVASLPVLTRRLCRTDLGLARLTPQAAPALAPYFLTDPVDLSGRALAATFAWADFFRLYYRVSGDRLLLFGEDGSAFLWLPPVGRGPLGPAVEEAAGILARLGRSGETWRIDGVPADQRNFFLRMGFRLTDQVDEFVCDRARMASLAGRPLHGMKAAANFFVKHNSNIRWERFTDEDIPDGLDLCRRWAADRRDQHPEGGYQAQIRAAVLMHYRVMRHVGELGLVGWTLRAGGRLVGYTIGYALPGADTAVSLVEVADRAFKGGSAYLFREFARSWAPVRWINVMGDSGLSSLRRAKMLYRPDRTVTAWTARPAAGIAPQAARRNGRPAEGAHDSASGQG